MQVVISNDHADEKLQEVLSKTENTNVINDEAYRHCVKGDALRIQNYYKESIDEYLVAISHDETNPIAFKGLGLSYKKIGLIKSALESLKKAKEFNPFDKEIYYELGSAYIENNDATNALKSLKRALKFDPECINAQFSLAVAHELINETTMAIDIYLKIIEKSPSYIAAYNNLASVYMKIGKYKEAISTFKSLLKINPEYSRAILGIAVSLDKLGEKNNSIRYYKKYIKMKPNSLNHPHVLNRINEIRKERKGHENGSLKLISITNA